MDRLMGVEEDPVSDPVFDQEPMEAAAGGTVSV